MPLARLMDYVTREQWGATTPTKAWTWLRPSRVEGIVVHHSGVKDGPRGAVAVQAFEAHHMTTRGWSSIAYNWLVDDRGVVYEGRRKGAVGGATKNWNFKTEAVCYVGDGDEPLPPDAANGLKSVIDYLQMKYSGTLWVKTHRDFASTSCPGTCLYDWVCTGTPAVAPPGGVAPPVDWDELIRYFWKVGNQLRIHPLKRGERGSVVKLVQEVLTRKGFNTGPIDGVFGWKTKRAVQAFQRSRAVLKANGVVSKETWDALFLG